MTQLPEVEVLRKDLEKEVVGKRVKDVTVKKAKVVLRHRNRPQFIEALSGRKVEGVSRRGTWLLFALDEDRSLALHLGPHGRLTRESANAEPVEGAQVVLTFTTGGALHLVEPGGQVGVFVAATGELDDIAELTPGGVDPLAGTFTWTAFSRYLAARQRPLKPLLVDESFVLGLGDVYADEILWSAGLAGSRPSDELSSQEVRRLYRALFEVLYEAVKQGGTSEPGDEQGDLFGQPGGYGAQLHVHERAGEPCSRCRRPIEQSEVEGRVVFHCPSCQT